jgi:vancomycin permeability regulator SanA
MQKINKSFFKKKWVIWPALILFLWVVLHLAYIIVDGTRDYAGSADVAVILGNRVFPDGSMSSWLKGRVDKALELYRQGRVRKIYASGGYYPEEEGVHREGDVMKAYLIAQGVKDSDVVADNQGQNSYLTAVDFLKWNQGQHFNSVIVVSQFYHITRCKYIFHKMGATQVYGASSDSCTWSDIIPTLREVPAFYKYLLAY